jgi:hypothetical protein
MVNSNFLTVKELDAFVQRETSPAGAPVGVSA